MTTDDQYREWPVWEATFISLWKLDPFFVSPIIDEVSKAKGQSKYEYFVPTVIVYFLHGLKRLTELIRDKKKMLSELPMHVFFHL